MNISVLQKFEIGCTKPIHMRQENIAFSKECCGVKLLFLSDLHLTRSRFQLFYTQLTEIAAQAQPDVILLGGDLVELPNAISDLSKLIGNLSKYAALGVGAIAGNHDQLVGVKRVKAAVCSSGARWLVDDTIIVSSEKIEIEIIGDINQAKDRAKKYILCSHNPNVFPKACALGIDLTLAGHLHGSQFVVGTWDNKLYPGALFFRWNGLRFQNNNSKMIVSRGLADTLPIRFNCPREVILCQI